MVPIWLLVNVAIFDTLQAGKTPFLLKVAGIGFLSVFWILIPVQIYQAYRRRKPKDIPN